MDETNDPTDEHASRRLRVALVGVFALALAVRLVYIYQYSRHPAFSLPVVDALTYHKLAVEVATGKWLPDRAFYQAPGYPYYLALLYTIWAPSFLFARAAGALIGSTTCLLTALLAARAFRSRPLGIAAGVVAALYGPLVFLDAELLPSVLANALFAAFLLLTVRATDAPRPRAWAAAGLVLGLCGLVRTECLAAALPLGLLVGVLTRSPRAPAVRLGVAFAAGLLLGYLPMLALNSAAAGRIAPLPSGGGVNLYLGNEPVDQWVVEARPGSEFEGLMHLPALEGRPRYRPWEWSTFWRRRAISRVAQHPLAWAGLLLKKEYSFWNATERRRNISPYAGRQWSSLLAALLWRGAIGLPFGLIAPLALAGILYTVGSTNPRANSVLCASAGVYVALILIFVTARYRTLLLPALIPFACWGARQLWLRMRSGWSATLCAQLTAVVAASVLCNIDPWPERPENPSELPRLLAVSALAQGRAREALGLASEALSLGPDDADANWIAGTLLSQAGEREGARRLFRRAVDLRPDFVQGWYGLAKEDLYAGNYDDAEHACRQALQFDPTDPLVNTCLAAVYALTDHPDLAEKCRDRALVLEPDLAQLYLHLTRPGPKTP